MVNTEKGKVLFESVKSCIVFREVKLDDVVQNNMKKPIEMPSIRESIFYDFQRMNPKAFFRKWRLLLVVRKAKMKVTK